MNKYILKFGDKVRYKNKKLIFLYAAKSYLGNTVYWCVDKYGAVNQYYKEELKNGWDVIVDNQKVIK